jgi:transcriptional regulator with XRE-family HTH domain
MSAIGQEKGPTPGKLAQLIRGLRERHEWSQAALAASAGLSERTVQRVENAEGSNRQTRRALARAFGFEDRDIFEKPTQMPSFEKTPLPKLTPFSNLERLAQAASDFLQTDNERLAEKARKNTQIGALADAFMTALQKHTELIPITLMRNGHTLRTMLEHGFCFPQIFGDHTPAAREAFAKLEDYLRDCRNIARAKIDSMLGRTTFDDFLKDHRNVLAHEYSATERVRIDADLDALLARIAEQHCVVGAGLQHCERELKKGLGPLHYQVVHIVLAPEAAFPAKVRVPPTSAHTRTGKEAFFAMFDTYFEDIGTILNSLPDD